MNERIQELKIQACKWASENAPISEYENVCDKKFAELIVRECIEQVRAVGDLRGANDDMIYGVDMAAIRLSKYFGVE